MSGQDQVHLSLRQLASSKPSAANPRGHGLAYELHERMVADQDAEARRFRRLEISTGAMYLSG